MVAKVRFIAARSKANVGDHVMHPTETVEERDASAAREGLPHPGAHNGTVPLLRPDTPPEVVAALGLRPGETPTRGEVHEIAGGYRADGLPIARSKYAAGAGLDAAANALLPPDKRRKNQGRWTTERGAPRVQTASRQHRDRRRESEPITVEQAAAVHGALRALAGEDGDGAEVRNNAGFNRRDTDRGRELAAKASLTPAEAAEGRRMARKYWRQIGEGALDAMGAAPLKPDGAAAKGPETPGDGARTGPRRTDTIDVMLYPDISWGIAHANAATPAGAAAVLSAFRAAADDTMAVFEREMGWTRRGKGGRLGPEPGAMTWLQFVQHTPRPDRAGETGPGLHAHHMVPAVVVTESGHVGAVHTGAKRGLKLGDVFHERLAVRGREMGMRVRLKEGAAVLLDVPDNVRAHFSRRSRDAERDARAYARRQGLDWKTLPAARKSAMVNVGARKTEGSNRDGMADRAAWRAECAALGFSPTDVARPPASVPSTGHVLGPLATPRQASAELVSAATRQRILAQVSEDRALARGLRPANILAAAARAAEGAFVVSVAASVAALAESRGLRKAAAAVASAASRMNPAALRAGLDRAKAVREAELAVGAVAADPGLEARRDAAALRREAVVIERSAARTPPEAIRAAFDRAREGRLLADLADALAPASAEPEPGERPGGRRTTAAPRQQQKRFVVTEAEAEAQLRDALKQAGVKAGGHEIRWTKRLEYLPVEGNKGTERSGGYRAHFDRTEPDGRGVASASLYNWRDTRAKNGFVGNWTARGEAVEIARVSPEEAAREAERRAEKKAAQEAATAARHADGAERARREYAAAGACPADHPYLARKGLAAPPPDWRMDAKGRIVVPMKLATGEHVNNETVTAEGEKRPVWGARVQGAAWASGVLKAGRPVVLVEGLATALSVRLATKEFVVACRDAGNLAHVAKAIRQADPARPIVFGADNDAHLPLREGDKRRENVGMEKARAAAAEIGNARVWIPEADPKRTAADKGTDWDDVRQAAGSAAVRASWEAFQGPSASEAPKAAPEARGAWAGLQQAGKAMPKPAGEAQRGDSASQGSG